jgi:hypothetical protein
MPSLEEVFEKVKFLMSKGDNQRKCHFGLIDVEAKERQENPKGKTRFIFETDDAEMYKRMNAQKDRWLQLIPNKSVAVDMMCRVWEECSDATITEFGQDEQS